MTTEIQGYRVLSDAEKEAINLVKAWEAQGAALLWQLSSIPDVDKRELALARTKLEDGCMRAVRSIARPLNPFAGIPQ